MSPINDDTTYIGTIPALDENFLKPEAEIVSETMAPSLHPEEIHTDTEKF